MMLGVALAFGGVAQLLAGMWEFRKGNVFGATVFSSYGAFWLSFWAYLTFYAEGIPAEHHGVAAGWYLIAWAIFTTLMLIACPAHDGRARHACSRSSPSSSCCLRWEHSGWDPR